MGSRQKKAITFMQDGDTPHRKSERNAIVLRLSEVMVDGVRSPALQGGPATSEEAVVFVHGNPGFSRDWEDLLERVGEFSRCLAPDIRPEEFNYTVDGYARHLGDLLTKLQVRSASSAA
jgi:pimeloyl-ACP methyl ester carboxylesterase